MYTLWLSGRAFRPARFPATEGDGVRNGYLRVSPFALRRVSQRVGRIGPPSDKKLFSRDQIKRVLTLMAADVEATAGWSQWRARRLYALTATVAYTGIRAGESLFLYASDVDLTSRFLAITDRSRAGGYRLKTEASAAPVPIPAALVPILEVWLSHRLDAPADFPIPDCPWLFPTLNRRSNWRGGPPGTKPVQRLQDVARRAGVEGLTFLALRHSFASHLEAHGAGPAMIQRLLRHSNPTTQMWYRRADRPGMTDNDLRRAFSVGFCSAGTIRPHRFLGDLTERRFSSVSRVQAAFKTAISRWRTWSLTATDMIERIRLATG